MKKVVFEGTINGEKFDNVQDYNNKLNELLAKGENISASSQTRIAGDEVENQPESLPKSEPVEEEAPEFDPLDYLLYFDNCEDHYLDRLVTGDDKVDSLIQDKLSGEINVALEDFEECVKNDDIDTNSCLWMISRIKDVFNALREDEESTDVTIEECNRELDKIKVKLKILENSRPVIKKLRTYYSNLFNLVRDYLLKNNF